MKTFYDTRILPQVIDFVCGLPPFEHERGRLVSKASGRILEVGIGTGRNLPYYRHAQVQCLCGVDPGLHPKAVRRAAQAGLEVEAIPLSAEKIPAEDASFDCIVCTFTLCTIPDAAAALSEMRRVLRPQGKLLFLEHGAAPDEGVRRLQDRITPYWKPLTGGCHLNRNPAELIRAAGFDIDDLETRYARGPRFLTYFYSGTAAPRPITSNHV